MKRRTRITRTTLALVATGAMVALAGCDDPAASKPKAEVASAQPVATATAQQTAAADQKIRLELNGKNTKVTWIGSKVTGKHEGGFKELSGHIETKSERAEDGKVSLTIDVSSIYSDNEKLTEHLKSEDFFHVEKFPKASFESTAIATGGRGEATHTITGNLTLHGVTKSIVFPATIDFSDERLQVKTEFSINRKDFGIDYPGMTGDLIRDDVVIELDLSVPRS